MFDAKVEKEKIINFIRDYYKKSNAKGAILGISGGKDSGIVAGIMCEALGSDNVIGVTMPCHSNDDDKIDAHLVSDYYGFRMLNFDLTKIYDAFKDELNFEKDIIGNFNDNDLKDSDINIKPRLRMATVYYLAALLSKINKGTYLVCGTSNKCELYVGYFTKGGDNVCDIAPIYDLTVSEVIELGKELNVPDKVLYKVPSDGLSNMTDEDKLGVTYSDIEKYLKDNNDKTLDDSVKEKINTMHKRNEHKFNLPKYIKEE